jgi:hypothetical protein
MTDTPMRYEELLEAAKAVLPLLKASTDHRDTLLAIEKGTAEENEKVVEKIRAKDRMSPAEKLRMEADEIEAKDAAILRFRAAVAAFSELA